MTDRTALGPADVSDADLATMLGADAIVTSSARAIDYALQTMTTGGRFWVEGAARHDDEERPFRLVVKIAQTVLRSPVMAYVPEQFRAATVETLPWEVEPDVYRADLPLPDGLRRPRILAVRDLDADSAAMWMEAVDAAPWNDDHLAHAAHLLGRLAASRQVQEVADRVGHRSAPHQARVYLHGRLDGQYVAAYRDGSVFDHPVVAAHYGSGLRDRLMSLVEAAPALVDEIESLPLLAAHGDACPNNLLPVDDGFVAIDWAFFGRGRVGFDLTQLLMSEIELGDRSADDLAARQDVAITAYREGLAAEGFAISVDDLRRAHDAQVAVGIALAAVPLEELDREPDALEPLVRERARVLEHVLSALDL